MKITAHTESGQMLLALRAGSLSPMQLKERFSSYSSTSVKLIRMGLSGARSRRRNAHNLPGYDWTVHQTKADEYLSATGTQSSGFNRLSTLSVSRRERDENIRYEAKSAGFGLHARWLHTNEGGTLARALRGLQDHYESTANTYRGHAEALKLGRVLAHNAGVNRRTAALSPCVRLDDLLGDGDAK